MSDLKLTQSDDGVFDLVIENGNFVIEDGFDTSIWVSLLTDARAPRDKVVLPENRRGWMGNLVSPVVGRDLGGLLWLTEQRRLTQKTLNEVVDYARKALNWFVEDGTATSLAVTGEITPRSGITLAITITALNGLTETHYINLWEVTGNVN
jgi:phage gp46-like protein